MERNVKIRTAKETDFNTIYSFVNELEEVVFEIKNQKNAFELNIKNQDCIYLIAELNDKSIGFLSCHSQYLLHHGGQRIAEIQEMYINPENRKTGVGKKMIEELKRIVKQKEIAQLEVTSNNIRADTHRFYERENFVQTHKKFTLKIERDN